MDHCCSLLDLGNYRHSHLAGGDGGDDTRSEQSRLVLQLHTLLRASSSSSARKKNRSIWELDETSPNLSQSHLIQDVEKSQLHPQTILCTQTHQTASLPEPEVPKNPKYVGHIRAGKGEPGAPGRAWTHRPPQFESSCVPTAGLCGKYLNSRDFPGPSWLHPPPKFLSRC